MYAYDLHPYTQQVRGQMAFAEYPVGRVVAGAPLELSTAQNTVFHHVLRGRPEEV